MLLGRERARDKLRRRERSVVLERRDHAAHFGNSRHLDAGADDTDAFSGIGEHFAPRIDDQRMAIGLTAVLMQSPLCRRDDITASINELNLPPEKTGAMNAIAPNASIEYRQTYCRVRRRACRSIAKARTRGGGQVGIVVALAITLIRDQTANKLSIDCELDLRMGRS